MSKYRGAGREAEESQGKFWAERLIEDTYFGFFLLGLIDCHNYATSGIGENAEKTSALTLRVVLAAQRDCGIHREERRD